MSEATRLVNVTALKTEIAEALSISEITEQLCEVELQVSGHQHRGLCPLHGENTPSFYVNDGKNTFHCFGCGAGGDAITLVREHLHLGFYETLYLMAAHAEVDINKYERPLTEEEKKIDELRRFCERWAQTFKPCGRSSQDVEDQFGVGVSHSWPSTDIPEYLKDKPWLRDGTILPYRMPNGRLVGWKVREMPGAKKDMRRTPREFPLHDETLFGIHIVRESLPEYDRELVIVEGEFDALACHAAGITNVVALGGSSFTEAHMAMLQEMQVHKICFLFDGDEAGTSAAHKTANAYWQSPVNVRVGQVPIGDDPESFLKKHNGVALSAHIYAARHALEYLLYEEWTRTPRTALSDKFEFVSWVQTNYGEKLNRTYMKLIQSELARWLDIPEIEIQDFLQQQEVTQLAAIDSERVLLGEAMRNQRYFLDLRKKLNADDLFLAKHQRMWAVLESLMLDNLDVDLTIIVSRAALQGLDEAFVHSIHGTGRINLDWHEQQVSDLALRRVARDEALAFRSAITDMTQDSDQILGQFVHEIAGKSLAKAGSRIQTIADQVDKAMETLHERMANPTSIHGIDLGTQFPDLTQKLQGLQPGRLVVAAANSRRGKSTITLQWLAAIAIGQAIPCDFISLEMDDTEIITKLASHITQINSMAISGGTLTPAQLIAVEKAMLKIRRSPLAIHTPSSMSPSQFLLYAREQRMQRKSEVFVVDYVQLVNPEAGTERLSKYEQIGAFSRMAKMQVARAMECTVVVCAQMRRDAADKDKPTAEDVGDSYQLVRDCDVFIILQGQDDSTGTDLWLDKNRQGQGNALMPYTYNKETQTLYSSGEKIPSYAILPDGHRS